MGWYLPQWWGWREHGWHKEHSTRFLQRLDDALKNSQSSGSMDIPPVQLYRALCSEGSCDWFSAPLLPSEIFNNFLFELLICKWSLMERWSMNRGDMHVMPICHCFLPPHSRVAFVMSYEYRILVNLCAWEFSKTQSKPKVNMSHLQLSKLTA